MQEIIKKINDAHKKMAFEKGPFSFFALFKKEDAPDLWVLIVSAQWAPKKNELEHLRYISKTINEFLTIDETAKLSHIILMDTQDSEDMERLRGAGSVKEPLVIKNEEIFGVPVKEAVLLALA
jgi:hypothetical protein